MKDAEHVVCVTIGMIEGNTPRMQRQVLSTALDDNMSGATVYDAIQGSFGQKSARSIHTEAGLSNLPVLVEVVDSVHKVTNWLHQVQDVVKGKGLIAIEPIDVWTRADRLQSEMVESSQRGEEHDFADDGLHAKLYTMADEEINGRPLYQVVSDLLRRRGIAWVFVNRGQSGFGDRKTTRRVRGWWRHSADIPILISMFDSREKLQPCLDEVAHMVQSRAMLISHPVHWLKPTTRD